MKRLVKLKIDVTKIDKSRLFKGAKGTYLDAAVFLDDDQDQYGNHGMITQDIPKEDRDKGYKGAILGNARIVWTEPGEKKQAPAQAVKAEENQADEDDDDIPF